MELQVTAGDTVKIDNNQDDTYIIESIEKYGISATGVMVKFVNESTPRILSAGMLVKV